MIKNGKVLLAEDDPSLAFIIKDNLEEAGYEVIQCPDGEQAWDRYQQQEFDIVLLDVMMPVKDGLWVAKKIRQKSDRIPLLFLTAKSMDEDKIKGFETGADDYITKPFNIRELMLRMEVFLKRTRKLHADNTREIALGKLQFSYASLKLTGPDEAVNLTQKEADLLHFLISHKNKILKRDEILLNVWGKDDYFLGRSMDVFFTKLRKYLKPEPQVNIETIHGVGYRLNAP